MEKGQRCSLRYSIYLLYWYTSATKVQTLMQKGAASHDEQREQQKRGRGGSGDVRGAALHRKPVPHWRQKIRPAALRACHLVHAAHSMDV